ncbi:MAG: hypothetical protein NXI20_07200 [bacterium]|nr:hypothetical protein [bacterium]
MWKTLPYRTKNIVLAVGFIVVVVLVYFVSFSRTISLYQENERLIRAESNKGNLPLKIASLNKKIQKTDSLIEISQVNYQTRLMNTLGDRTKARKVKLTSIQDESFKQFDGLPYETFKITFQGKFVNLVKLLNDIEGNFGLGIVQSVNFRKVTDKRTKQVSLYLDVYLTRVKSKDE